MLEPEVRGTAFLGILKFIKLQRQPDALFKQVLEGLPPEAQKVCSRKFIAVVDYPYQVFIQLLRTVDKVLGTGSLELCRELGRFAGVRDFESLREMMPNFHIKPRDLFRDCNTYWQSYYLRAGEMKAESADHQCVLRIDGFEQMDPAHCRLMEGWMAQALVEAGGSWLREIRETRCAANGAPFHEFGGEWEETKPGDYVAKFNPQLFVRARPPILLR